MRRANAVPLLLCALLAVTVFTGPVSAQTATPIPPRTGSTAITSEPGRLLIKLDPKIGPDEIGAALAARGLVAAGSVPALGIQVVAVAPGTEKAKLQSLQNDPQVVFVEPDYEIHAFRTPNDPYYATDQWNLTQISAPQGWDVVTGSNNVIIAVVDTGVDLGHPDLSAKIVPGHDFVNNDDTAQDDEGHGTHVAGIAAASTNNGVGVAGVAWGASIMPVKVLGSNGSGSTSNVANGVTWAVDHGAKVINLSLGASTGSTTLQSAIDYAYAHNVLVVAAMGNEYLDGNPVEYPAAYAHVLAVAATDDTNGHASYSNTGSHADVAAPGGDPTDSSDSNPRHWIFSTFWRGGGTSYTGMAGTSMATPEVSGLAALVYSRHPTWSSDQVEQAIESSADDLGAPGKDSIFGAGLINVQRTLGQPFPYRVHLPLTAKMPKPPQATPLVNGNFEAGATGWIQFSTHEWPLIVQTFTGSVTPHSGAWAAWLGGDLDDISYVSQRVTVPAATPWLTYYHWIASSDDCGYDFGGVLVGTSVVDAYNLCTSTATGGWVAHSVNLSAYANKEVDFQIRVETDASNNSNLFVDDVAFRATPLAAQGLSATQNGDEAQPKAGALAPASGTGSPIAAGAKVFGGATK